MKKVIPFILILFMFACGTSTNDSNSDDPSQGNSGTEEPIEEEDRMNDDSNSNQSEMVLDDLEFTSEVEPSDEQVNFYMTLTNHSDETAEIAFSSGQQYEITVTDPDSGEVVYKFSEGMMFTEAIEYKELEPDESLKWEQSWDYKQNGEKVEAKDYEVRLELLPMTINGEKPDDLTPLIKEQTLTVSNSDEQEQAESGSEDYFRNVQVTGENGQYKVKGEARVFEGSFHYVVEDGHHVYVEEQTVQTGGAPGWGTFDFQVNIDKEELPEHGVLTLVLYLDGPKEGEPTGHHFVTLEDFNP
ncbi:BsuPI-related putative proteinase inhibitor [Piscibacillus halophilus]|uniref:Immunoglobulin-like domain of spore germination n=1 Tax=Piscibacillus halophilus TaxID=571933 RepID=A0A1H9B2L8_9BACI|nr:BsuPI-related putative proteinase inhibitor [Piscibacillus halophilus]SEP82903.1 Immunoglobulin-like domain of spore germination [Piscibacillus halophilus]